MKSGVGEREEHGIVTVVFPRAAGGSVLIAVGALHLEETKSLLGFLPIS